MIKLLPLITILSLFAFFLVLHWLASVTDSHWLKLVQDRLNIIAGYPFLILLDCLIVWMTEESWLQQRQRSDNLAVEIWARNAKPKLEVVK